jgi:hypothetical protein
MVQLNLSAAYLGAVHASSMPDNFQFIDQHGQVYPCNIVIAQLLSPRVAQLLSSDPTIDSLEIEVTDESDFCLFASLLHTGTVDLSIDHLTSSLSMARQLGNGELVKQLLGMRVLPSELTPSNIVEQLQFFEKVNEVPPNELVRFAGTNFFRLSEILSHQLRPETLDLILSESLILESEDSFFDFLKGEISEGSFDLLRHVEICCLSEEKYREFMAFLELSRLTPVLWDRIRSIRPDRSHRPDGRFRDVPVPFKDRFFDGIFAHLNGLAGGNCVQKGMIEAKESNRRCGQLHILFSDNDWPGNSNLWRHDDVLNGWFKIDFKGRRVSVTHYAIHNSLTYTRACDFLKTWTLEGLTLTRIQILTGPTSILEAMMRRCTGRVRYRRFFRATETRRMRFVIFDWSSAGFLTTAKLTTS